MTNDTPTEKRCRKCDETKPLDAFCKDRQKKDGLRSYCKVCESAYYAANRDREIARRTVYYVANRDREIARSTAYNAAHPDKHRAHDAAYRTANPDKIRARDTAYRAANPDKIRARYAAYRTANHDRESARHAAYRRNNRDKRRAYNQAYRAANPDIFRAAWQRRRARIKGNGGAGVSSAELAALRAAQSVFCAYCQLPWIAPLQIDHVIPLVQGGPHEIANIVFACRDCNGEKQGRTPEQWTNRWYERRQKN